LMTESRRDPSTEARPHLLREVGAAFCAPASGPASSRGGERFAFESGPTQLGGADGRGENRPVVGVVARCAVEFAAARDQPERWFLRGAPDFLDGQLSLRSAPLPLHGEFVDLALDRKSTRLNSSHVKIS